MRFRLLSYVAAMLLLAGVVGANLTPRPLPDIPLDLTPLTDVPPGQSNFWLMLRDGYGWPLTCAIHWQPNVPDNHVGSRPKEDFDWRSLALAINIVIGLAIPIAGLLACEFVLRRYEPKRKSE